MQNSVADLAIRIKNGYMAGKPQILVVYSRLNEKILNKLKELKYIKSFKVAEKKRFFSVDLVIDEEQSVFTDVAIFSKPGMRYYVSYRDLVPVMSGYGYSILSTPKGIMTNKEARLKKLGGELLFNIW